ncbi:4-hydroxythreonine-4-phosphate dehydrogenase PdxA [Erythrobacter sp. QSSC1-22B]|uniref:4-hydroxythreonine-4-phosphate dehydrogenase PdxA n=1 Tax=Erythrobacter sp. QSSC1-22B TaxID=1860125 RepID=UPI000804A556|nr:4-hydroxythreonine-4-phosphate dehydrogenase PdxA [Erythrobacter sp. QSSC1-22B]OBX20759.1 4-hydroxythreonine-4-phosphate dehydrogenase PdxA [Erythrobacter sp. QSSC1-22B]
MSGSHQPGNVPPLALSLGDPAGIGPELIAEAWFQRRSLGLAPFVVFGGATILHDAARSRGLDVPIVAVDSIGAVDSALFERGIPVLSHEDADYTPGQPSLAGAQLALHSLTEACRAVHESEASALVTLPVAKSQLALAGFGHPGQTEFLAQQCGVSERDAVMMLAGPSLRAVPLTVHCPLAEVPRRLTVELIIHKARIVARALRADFGIDRPRLALAGLNPHAGENGQMGSEEIRIIAPAIAALREEGIDATGPHPGDALFTRRARETYDVALAMYHDQALIPLKALDFDEGVNVTLGLPIVRTSPDHGTAFAIAGEGIADPGATFAALRMASECAARRARLQV